MNVSEEAIALYYICDDGQQLVSYDVGETIRVTRAMRMPLIPNILGMSLIISTNKTRWLKRALSYNAVDDGCVSLIESIQGLPITITTDLLEQTRFYAKFMEV